ncbi:hypothetical protein [Candidatus Poriferisodalis sp.]|uniref:hypothetical protein n=1 Tax=Candidatus Poriferisodalis sp. TaxID=3101277 RepID=UPI003B011BFF
MTRTTKTLSGLAGLYLVCFAFVVVGPLLHCAPESASVPEFVGVGDQPSVSETYLIKQAQVRWAEDMRDHVLTHLGLGNVPVRTNADHWSKSSQRVRFNAYDDDRAYGVTFTNTGFSNADITYGDPDVISDPAVNHGDSFSIVDNCGSTIIEHQIDVTVTEEHSVETTVSHSTTFDWKAGAEEKVGGEFAGVSLEVTLSQEFGQSFSHEESQTKSENTSTEKTISDKVDIPPPPEDLDCTYVLITVGSQKKTVQYPFSAKGDLSWGIELALPKPGSGPIYWTYKGKRYGDIDDCFRAANDDGGIGPGDCDAHNDYDWFRDSEALDHFATDRNNGWRQRENPTSELHPYVLKFATITDFYQLWRGDNTEWPAMENDALGAAHSAAHLLDNNRYVEITGTQVRVAEEGTEYSLHDISDPSCDQDAIKEAFDTDFEGLPGDKLDELGCKSRQL